MRNAKKLSRIGDTSFITAVTKNREPIFSQRKNIILFIQTMREVQAINHADMISYVILPDHVHLIIKTHKCTSMQIMNSLKRNFTKNWRLLTSDDIEKYNPLSLWQPKFWEHVISRDQDLHAYINYVINNPVKHGYVDDPEDWPYSSFAENISRNDLSFNEMEPAYPWA